MPPRRNARSRRASASRSETDSIKCNEEGCSIESISKSCARGQGKRKVAVQLSPNRDISHLVAATSGDSFEVTDDQTSLTEPPPRRILRSDSCIRVVVNESGDGPPLKKWRRSEPAVKLRQITSPKEHGKLPGSVAQLLSYSPFPAVETGEDVCLLSSDSAAFSVSLSVEKPKEMIAEEADPKQDLKLSSEEASSGIQVMQVDDEKELMKSTTPMQSVLTQPSMKDESSVLPARHLIEQSSSTISTISGLIASDSLDTSFRIHQECARSKPLEPKITIERMISRNLTDCLKIELEEDFKPDYDEDDKQDAAGSASVSGPHSTKSSSHSDVTSSTTSLMSTPFPVSPASSLFLPSYIGERDTLLFQPCPSAPESKYPTKSGRACVDAMEGTPKTFSRKGTNDSLDFPEICVPDLTDRSLSEAEEKSDVGTMDDLKSLDDIQFLSRLSQHVPRSPVTIPNPVPRRFVKASGCSKSLNLESKFQYVRNKQASSQVSLSSSTSSLSQDVPRSPVSISNPVADNLSSANFPSPMERNLMLQTTSSPAIAVSKGKCEAEVSSDDMTGLEQLHKVEMDLPQNLVKVSDGSKPLNLGSRFQSVRNKQATSQVSCSSSTSSLSQHVPQSPVSIPNPVAAKVPSAMERHLTLQTTRSPAIAASRGKCEAQISSVTGMTQLLEVEMDLPQVLHVAKTVIKGTSTLDVDQQSNSTRSVCDLSPGVNSSTKTLYLSLSSNTSGSGRLMQSIAIQTDEEEKVCFSSEIELDNQVHTISLLPINTEQQSESKSAINLHIESPHDNKIQSAPEDNSVAKDLPEVIKLPTSTCAPFLTTKSRILPRLPAATGNKGITEVVKLQTSPCPPFATTKSIISPRIPAATGNKSIFKKVVPEPILDGTQSPSLDDNSNPRKFRLKRPWKMSDKRNDAVSDAASPSFAKVPSPMERNLTLQTTCSPAIAVSVGKCETDVSSDDTTGMKQLSEVEMDLPQVLQSSPAMQVSVSVLRQSSKESGASEEILEGDGSSNEEELFVEESFSSPANSRNEHSSPTHSNQRSPATCSQHLLRKSEELLAKPLLSAEENQLRITVTAGERSMVSLQDPESSLGESSSFANDVATWVSQKETKTDSFYKSANIKKTDLNLSVTEAISNKAYASDLPMDLFEELTCEEFVSDFDDEFEDISENSPTEDMPCESLLQSLTSSDSLSSAEAICPLEKGDLPITDASDLVKTGWFPIPSRRRSAVIPAKTSVALLPSESMTERKVPRLMQDHPASQSRFSTEELPAKRVEHTPSDMTNRLAAPKAWLVTKAPQPETADVFQNSRNLIEKRDWKSLSQLLLTSRSQRRLYISYLVESLMSISDIGISFSFKRLVKELETSAVSVKQSFRKHVIGLVGIDLMERCTAFGNWSDAFEVLAELLNKKIYFHLSSSQEHSADDIVATAIRICVTVKKYNMIAFLVRQFNFFRARLTPASDEKMLIKMKYFCLNSVLLAIVKELPGTGEGQVEENGKVVLCNIGISILTQILKDWKEDVSKQHEVAELIELSCVFEFLIQGCIVHKCSDGLILLSQLQECHPEYLEWRTSTLHTVILFFLKLGMVRVLLSDELPLNLIRTATERQLIPKLPEYISPKSNVLVVWPSLSDLEMRLVILMYLKSILLRVPDLSVSSVPWSIQMVNKDPVFNMKSSHMESMSSLQSLLHRDINPSLKCSKLSPMLLRIDYCPVSLIRKILSDASVDFKSSCSASQVPPSFLLSGEEPIRTGDVDLRQLPWNRQHSVAESRVGFSSLPTTQLKTSAETLKPSSHFSLPQNRFRKFSDDKQSHASPSSSAPVSSSSAKIAYRNLNSTPAKKIPKLDSFVLSVPEIAREGFSSSITGSSTRKVLLKTPKSVEESPTLLLADASASGMDLKPHAADRSFVQSPSNPLVHSLPSLSDAIRDGKVQWDRPSSRRQKTSFFQKQNPGASSSNTIPKPQQPDLRQRLMNKKVSRLVELPSNAGKPVQKLLDLDLLPRPSPPYLPFK